MTEVLPVRSSLADRLREIANLLVIIGVTGDCEQWPWTLREAADALTALKEPAVLIGLPGPSQEEKEEEQEYIATALYSALFIRTSDAAAWRSVERSGDVLNVIREILARQSGAVKPNRERAHSVSPEQEEPER